MGPTTPASNSRHAVQTPTYRLRLNDYMQQWRRRDKVKWVASASGRQERPQWTVTCFLNDIRYGTGRSLTKSDAKELAAKETLEIIYRQNAPNYGVESYKWPVEGGGDHHHHHYSYGYPIAASTSAYAPVSHPYIATPGTPAAGLQPLPTTSASSSHYAYPSQYPAYQYQPYYHTQHAPQQQTYYVYSASDPYYRH